MQENSRQGHMDDVHTVRLSYLLIVPIHIDIGTLIF